MGKIVGIRDIKNCPDYVKENDLIVARVVDGRLWFYGDYKDNLKRAVQVADEVDGIMMVAKEVGDDVSEA